MDAEGGPFAKNTTTPNSAPYTTEVWLRIIGAHRKRPDHWMTSYIRALEITGYSSIETTLRTRRLYFVGGGAYSIERRAVAKATHF